MEYPIKSDYRKNKLFSKFIEVTYTHNGRVYCLELPPDFDLKEGKNVVITLD